MDITDIPQPLRDFIAAYLDVEVFWHAWPDAVRKAFEADPAFRERIQAQYAELLTRSALDTRTYRKLTNQPFESDVHMRLWLRERWVDMFGDVPIPGDD